MVKMIRGGFRPVYVPRTAPLARPSAMGRARSGTGLAFPGGGLSLPKLAERLHRFSQTPLGRKAIAKGQEMAGSALKFGVEKLVSPRSLPHSKLALFRPKRVTAMYGTGLSRSVYKTGELQSPLLKTFLATCQKSIMNFSTSGQVSATENAQGVYQLLYFDKSTYDNTTTKFFTGTGSFDNYTDSAQLSGKTTVQSMVWSKCDTKIQLTNRSLINTNVIIYDVVAKIDASSNATFAPINLWSTGLNDLASAGAGSYQQLASRPWHSPYFNAYWSIVNSTEINLAAGGSHEHSLKLAPNVSISQFRALNAQVLGHITRAVLIVVRGTPVHGVSGEAGEVAVGTTGIDITSTSSYTTFMNHRGRTSYTHVSELDDLTAQYVVGQTTIDAEQNIVSG